LKTRVAALQNRFVATNGFVAQQTIFGADNHETGSTNSVVVCLRFDFGQRNNHSPVGQHTLKPFTVPG
jgi:hypothetical protein